LSLKTHVRWLIWFSSFYQLWFSELEIPCVLTHMVFKPSSTLDFWPWKPYALDFRTSKPMCVGTYGFQDAFNSKFENPCVSTHMVFKLFSILDFQAWKPMCASTYGFQVPFNSWFLSTYGFQATLNSSLPNLISRFIWPCHCI
jgi:hypothetical protein